MSKKDIVIKSTKDRRFHVAGLVVNTIEEAFDRYDKKLKREPSEDNWYYLVEQDTVLVDGEPMSIECGFPGNKKFVRQVAHDIMRI